jgi:GWxTD domain-containing protein
VIKSRIFRFIAFSITRLVIATGFIIIGSRLEARGMVVKRVSWLMSALFLWCLVQSSGKAAEPTPEARLGKTQLRDLVHAHPDSALLHARLASIYFAEGTIEGRSLAVKHLKSALKIDPADNRFRLMLAEVYFEATFWTRGVKELERVLKTEPGNGYARFRLGRAYLEKAIEEWQRDSFESARRELSLVEKGHPAFARARRKLALCCFDMGQPDSASAMLEALPEDSLDTEALLVLGMALNDTRDLEAADRAFARALSAMDEVERERYLSVDLIATPGELDRFADLPPTYLDRERDLFWKERDPNPATAYNERFIEHMARVAFAELHFSIPRLDRHGSQTTRGEVFIRYGRPVAWFYDPFGTNTFADETVTPAPSWSDLGGHSGEETPNEWYSYRSRPLRVEKSRWVWKYPNFVLDFEDAFLNGDYTFPYERDWSAYTYAYLEREIPEIYETQIKRRMRVVMDALNRLDEQGNPVLRLVYACDTRGVDYQPDYEWPKGEFEVQIALLDSTHTDLTRLTLETKLAADSSAMYRTVYPIISSSDFTIPPGNAIAAVSIRSESNGAVGFTSVPVRIRSFGKGLRVSDVELRFTQDGPVNPSHVYLWRGKAYLAFDIRNLMVDRVGTGRAEVAYKIAKRQDKAGVARRLTDYLGFTSMETSPRTASLESRYELRAVGPAKSETIGIDLAPLSKGYYDVELKVTDLLSGETATVVTGFTVASELQP